MGSNIITLPFVREGSHKAVATQLADVSKLGREGAEGTPTLGYSEQLAFREMEALRGRPNHSFIGSKGKRDPGGLPGVLSSVLHGMTSSMEALRKVGRAKGQKITIHLQHLRQAKQILY